jgi:hypothetical protein
MLRRLLFASLLFGILGTGSGCCLLQRLLHCETYCGPSCGPTYWGPYCVAGCDPCDTCGNFVGHGYSDTAPCCGHGSGSHHAHYDGGHYDGGHYDGGHYDGGHYDSGPYDGEIIYEGPVHDAPVHTNAVYQRPARDHVTSATYHHDAPERKVPHVWRMP